MRTHPLSIYQIGPTPGPEPIRPKTARPAPKMTAIGFLGGSATRRIESGRKIKRPGLRTAKITVASVRLAAVPHPSPGLRSTSYPACPLMKGRIARYLARLIAVPI